MNEKTNLNDLSDNCILHIALALIPEDTRSLMMINKHFYKILLEESKLWQHLANRQFPLHTDKLIESCTDFWQTYKASYKSIKPIQKRRFFSAIKHYGKEEIKKQHNSLPIKDLFSLKDDKGLAPTDYLNQDALNYLHTILAESKSYQAFDVYRLLLFAIACKQEEQIAHLVNFTDVKNQSSIILNVSIQYDTSVLLTFCQAYLEFDVSNLTQSYFFDICTLGSTNVIKFFLDNRFDADITNEYLLTGLHLAARFEQYNTCKFLIESRANVNAQDSGGNSPLHEAAQASYDITELMLKNNANPNVSNIDKATPLMYAVVKGQTNIFNLLISYGANLTLKATDQRTLLQIAVTASPNMVELILSKKCHNVYEKNMLGESALSIAIDKGLGETALMLFNAMPKPNLLQDKEKSYLIAYAMEFDDDKVLEILGCHDQIADNNNRP